MTVSDFNRDCSIFIFTHHKKIVPVLQSTQHPQLQDTPSSGTYCVGFYPLFQADCEQLGQVALHCSRDTCALSTVLIQILGHHSALYLVQFTHTRLRSVWWPKITISSTEDLHDDGPGSGTLKCLNELFSHTMTFIRFKI